MPKDITPQFEVTPTSDLIQTKDSFGRQISGWRTDSNALVSNKVRIESASERILIGDATEPLTGIGLFLGRDGDDYEFRVGDPDGAYVHWDGSDLTVVGDIYATGGTIGGFDLGSNYIRDVANSFGLSSAVTVGDDVRFWAGATFANKATAPLRITEAGAIVCSNLTVTGGSVVTSVLGGMNTARLLGRTTAAVGAVEEITVGTGLTFSSTNLACSITQYTDEMVDDRVSNLIKNGTGITWTYNDSAGTLTGNVSITQYTDASARAAISETVTGLDYSSSTGVLSLSTGYVIPTTTQESNWGSAYSWGDHSLVGYLKNTSGIALLSTIGSINAKTVATTTLYTVPVGKTAIITSAVVRVTAAEDITVVPTLGIGVAAGEADIFAPVALTGLDATTKTWTFNTSGLSIKVAAEGIIKCGIDTGATATTDTIAIDLFGYLI